MLIDELRVDDSLEDAGLGFKVASGGGVRECVLIFLVSDVLIIFAILIDVFEMITVKKTCKEYATLKNYDKLSVLLFWQGF